MVSDFAFHCSACGKCCNSSPAMTVAELFHHETRFVGCLAIGRVRRPVAGTTIQASQEHVLSHDEAGHWNALQETLLFDPHPGSPYRYSISTQGFDYPSAQHCPALDGDQRCGIHHDRKPVMCSTVPLDPLLPDELQHVVLQRRSTVDNFIGAGCIVPGSAAPTLEYRPLVWAGRLADPDYADSLQRRRSDLALEKRIWGEQVLALFRQDLFGDPVQLARLPENGFLTLPLAPVIAVLAAASDAGRARSLQFLDAQLALIEARIAQALQRKLSAERDATRQMRSFLRVYEGLRSALAAPSPPAAMPASLEPAQLHAYLGLA